MCETKQARQWDDSDRCLFRSISDTRLCSFSHSLAKYPQCCILWWKESIKALCTPGAVCSTNLWLPMFLSVKKLHTYTARAWAARSRRCHLSSPVSRAWILIQHVWKWVKEALAERKPLLASSRYDQSAAYAPQRGKQDGAEDQSELTLWFMKAELLMLTGFLKIIVVVNIHVKRETVIKWSHNTETNYLCALRDS